VVDVDEDVDDEVDDDSPLSLAAFRLSVMYQPDPLKMTPAG
jgi:hypothetical protein